MHVISLDEPDVGLPVIIESTPDVDHVAVAVQQVRLVVEDEGRGDPFAGFGSNIPVFERRGDAFVTSNKNSSLFSSHFISLFIFFFPKFY